MSRSGSPLKSKDKSVKSNKNFEMVVTMIQNKVRELDGGEEDKDSEGGLKTSSSAFDD